ncbi:MAG: dihydrodipicolinate synthase family protein [Sphaerochaeta sp.]
MNKLNTKGIYSALLTPYDGNGNVDYEELKKLVEFEKSNGVEGFYCCGSSGEGLLLEKEERMKIVETVSKECGEIPFIVHTGALSTKLSLELSLHAQENGACAISMIPPIYYKYTVEEIASHYLNVANKLDIGVIVYNIPQFTGISLTTDDNFLQNKKIIGIKHTSMNLYELERMIHLYPQKTFFNGFDEIYLSSLSAGATATIGTTVNICPKLIKGIRTDFENGNMEDALNKQHLLNNLIETLVNTSVFPGAKYCMELQGLKMGGCREPFAPLSLEQKKEIQKALEKIQSFL